MSIAVAPYNRSNEKIKAPTPLASSEKQGEEVPFRLPGEQAIRSMLTKRFGVHFVYPATRYRPPSLDHRFIDSLEQHQMRKGGWTERQEGDVKLAIEILIDYMNSPYVLDHWQNDDERDAHYKEVLSQIASSARDKLRDGEFQNRVWEVIKKDTLSLNFISKVYTFTEILWSIAVARYASTKHSLVQQLTDRFSAFSDIAELTDQYHSPTFTREKKLEVVKKIRVTIRKFLAIFSKLQERRMREVVHHIS